MVVCREIKKFFSIIIPVYNGMSRGLDKCLNSIWQQEFEQKLYEVIVVDDASTDQTFSFCVLEKSKHFNLHILRHEKNHRQGAARNTGLRFASGKYILFIDADDYYHHDALKNIYNELQKEELDALCCASAWQKMNGPENNFIRGILPFQETTDGITFIRKNGVVCSAWKYVLKREYIFENNLFFPENIQFEDTDWSCKVCYYAKAIRYAPILMVHYNRHDNQTTSSLSFQAMHDQFFSAFRVVEFFESLPFPEKKILDLGVFLYHLSLKNICFCFAPAGKKYSLIQKFIFPVSIDDRKIKMVQRFPFLFCIASNLSVVPFRILRVLLTFIRWKTTWKAK